MTSQRILVVGAGALGIASAVRLAAAGHLVSVVASSESKRAHYRAHPFRLDAYDAPSQQQALDVLVSPNEVDEPFDLLIAATKCASAIEVTRKWLPALKADGIFVPYFNGLMGDELLPIVGERLVECAVYYPATLVAPGHSLLSGPGGLHLGPWPRGRVGPGSRAGKVAAVLSAVVATDTYDDMVSVKWNKLVANCAMTSLGVISGMQMRDMMQHATIRNAYREVFREALAVAVAAGARPMTLGGINVGLATKVPRFVFDIALRLRTRRSGNYKSSSQQSLDRGEPTEVAYLNGRVVGEGQKHGIATPWNAAIVRAVKEVEAAPGTAGLGKIGEMIKRARA
ncbi:MAG: ketopantoate reductase family protein [Burkholderiales bacterium]|nr:ketopantoate reductase family protein [Burkholderiales bacterium]